jgi:hypothetical protein
MFYNEQINNLNELEKATLLTIINDLIPVSGQIIEPESLNSVRKDVLRAKIDFSLTKVAEESKLEFEEVLEGIKVKLNLK